jgi:type I restriction enzyme S subunit
VSGINAAKGAIAIYGAENDSTAAATIHYGAYIPNKARVAPNFLWWLLRSNAFREILLEYVPGGIKTELKAKRFLPIPVPLPPLPEQRRIVARIEQLAAKSEEAQGLRRQAVEEAGAVAHATARFLISEIAGPVTELAEWLHPRREGIQTGPFGAQLSSSDFTDTGIPLLTIGNVQYEGLDVRNLKYVSSNKANELSRYHVCEGDILFARMGTVGRCCVVPREADGWLINYHIIRVALDMTRAEPRFIHWTIQSSGDVQAYLEKKIRGATREGVNSKIVASLPCRVPALSEQRSIVVFLDDLQARMDSLKRLQSDTAAELDALLPSVLDKAFKGEL